MTISPTAIIAVLCSLIITGFCWWANTVNKNFDAIATRFDKAGEIISKDHETLGQIAFRLHFTQGDFAAAPIAKVQPLVDETDILADGSERSMAMKLFPANAAPNTANPKK